VAFAQYAPATPAPYNPIALAEVTGTPRAAVQAWQNNYQTLSQNPYLGGVPAGKLSATPVALSLEDAVARGLKQNLGGVLATDVVTDARGQRWQALSELLPNVVTDSGFGVHQINVKAAFGLTIHGEPPIIGPFGYFDSRAYLTQSAFDWASIERARSSKAQVNSAEFSSKDAREILVLVIVWSSPTNLKLSQPHRKATPPRHFFNRPPTRRPQAWPRPWTFYGHRCNCNHANRN
jgi:outer membrane protein TolC